MNMRSEQLAPGFMVLHGNRLEDLRDLLIRVIKNYQLPVLSPEIILIQNNGMKHWVERSLASDDAFGICAATRIELPSSYLWSVYRTVLKDIEIPVHMPFDKKNLTWRLYKILPELINRDSFEPLRRYLGEGSKLGSDAAEPTDARRLFQLASQIADVFDGYQNYRCDWLMDWANGHDQLITDSYLKDPGKPRVLAKDEVWQSELWRALRADIGPELEDASRANVHAQFLQKMDSVIEDYSKTQSRPTGLPERVVIFGISSLPPQVIEAFAKLGKVCQVFMFVQNPCESYWGDIVDGHEMLRALSRRRQSANPSDMHLTSHPLLASWGKQGRDYFHLLDDFDHVQTYKGRLEKVLHKVDVFVDPLAEKAPKTQLAVIQSTIFNLTPTPDQEMRLKKVQGDESIQFVSAHSAQREVEVLHDQLHFWFDKDPDLKPEDVMVMVPDMDSYLAHIKAVFARFKIGDTRYIPFSIADTTPKESPVVRALTQLLSLPTLKISIVDWMDLFEVDAVCKKFELSSADVAQIKEWIIGAGVRWGLDVEHRVQHGMDKALEDVEQNTWAFGVRRLLLGYALDGGESWGETLAYPAVNGLDGPLMSKLLVWIEEVQNLDSKLRQDHTPVEWVQIFKTLIEKFFTSCDDAQERLLIKIFDPLEAWEKMCIECGLQERIPLNVVREYWLSQLEEVGLQQRFFGGGVQFGTLMPMRSIPFKIICLLGMNDGAFPRQTASRDFDLMAKNWRTGDRSRREDDRYLFLEALLCARQKLYVSWQGHSARDNSEQPPSVLVAQLIDYVKAVWADKVRVVQHPLQPFSRQYFEERGEQEQDAQGEFEDQTPLFTYDSDWDVSTQSLGAQSGPVLRTSSSGVSDAGTNSNNPAFANLPLKELQLLLRHPVQVFFCSRLNIYIDSLNEELSDTEPFALNALDEYKIGDELLSGSDLGIGMSQLHQSGQLPMQGYGINASKKLEAKVQAVIQQRDEWTADYQKLCEPLHLAIQLGETLVEGSLLNLRTRASEKNSHKEYLQIGQRIGAVSEKIGGHQCPRGHIITQLWVNHLLACASGYPTKTIQIGADAQIIMDPLDALRAKDILYKLIQVYKDAWTRPLPVACKTAWTYVHCERLNASLPVEDEESEGVDSHDEAAQVFESSFGREGERKESAYLSRAFESYTDIRDELPQMSFALYADMADAVKIRSAVGETV